jgi:branched-chain amino acid transport system permease protein
MTSPAKRSMGHLAIVAGLFAAWYLLSIPLDQPGGILSSLNRFTVFDVIVAIMLAVSLNLILGMTGQFSLGHAGFVAVGAYTAMVIAGKAGFFLPQLAFWHSSLGLGVNSAFVMITLTSMAGAMLVCALLGLLVGLPTLRLRGDYLAIATLGFGEIVATLITNSEYLGRALGLQLKTSRREWVTDHLDNPPPLLDAVSGYLTSHLNMISIFWAFACLTVTIMVVRNIKYSTTGRALMAIREDIVASEATGIPTVRYKIAAFIIGAALAGLGGALYAHYTALNPAGFRFMFSVTIVLFVILGGQGSITGSVVAAAALTILPVAIQRNTVLDTTVTEKWRMVVYALLIILAMLFMPRGIFGRYEITDLARWLWRKARSHAQGARDVDVQPPATDLPPGLATLAAENEPGELPAPLLSAEHVTMQFGGLRRSTISTSPSIRVNLSGSSAPTAPEKPLSLTSSRASIALPKGTSRSAGAGRGVGGGAGRINGVRERWKNPLRGRSSGSSRTRFPTWELRAPSRISASLATFPSSIMFGSPSMPTTGRASRPPSSVHLRFSGRRTCRGGMRWGTWASSTLPTSPRSVPMLSPTATSAAWRSPAPLPPGPVSFCSTSPPPA